VAPAAHRDDFGVALSSTRAHECHDLDPHVAETVELSLWFDADGLVETIVVMPPFTGTAAARCFEEHLAGMSVPAMARRSRVELRLAHRFEGEAALPPFDREKVDDAVARLDLSRCRESGGPTGRATLHVDPDGIVSRVRPAEGTPERFGGCLARVLAQIRVEPFAGPAHEIDVAFEVRGWK
jgi:hypothetical protein